MEIVRIVNKWDRPLRLPHDEHGDREVPVGGEAFLSLDYIAVAFGHPNAADVGKNQHRTKAYRNALRFWGHYPGLEAEIGEWETRAPQYEVYNLDGERIWTVLEDPKGEKGGGHAAVGVADPSAAAMSAEIVELRKMVQTLVDQQKAAPPLPVTADAMVHSGDTFTDSQIGAAFQQVAQANTSTAAKDEVTIPTPPPGSDTPADDKPRTARSGRK